MSAILRMRAAAAGYIVFGVIFGGLVALGVAILIQKPENFHKTWPFVAIPLAMLVGFWSWLLRFELRIENGEISYRSLFRGMRRIPLSSIRRSSFQVGKSSRDLRPLLRLEYALQDGRLGVLHINLKVFRLDDVGRLLEILAVDRSREKG